LDNLARLLESDGGEEKALFIWVQLAGRVRQLGAHRLDTLVRILSHPKALEIATSGGEDFLKKWKEILARSASKEVRVWVEDFRPPESIFLKEIFLFLERFFQEEPGSQRRALDLFNVIVPPDIFHQWGLWWEELLRLLAPPQRIPETLWLVLKWSESDVAVYQSQLESLACEMPPEMSFLTGGLLTREKLILYRLSALNDLPGLQEVIFDLVSPEQKTLYKLALQWISRLPASWRLESLYLFKKFLASTSGDQNDYLKKQVVPLFRELLRSLPPEKLPIFVQNREQLEGIFWDEIPNWKRTWAAIVEWVGTLEQSDNLHVPILVSQATDDPHWQQAILLELASSSLNLSKIFDDALSLAIQMIDETKQLVPTIEKLEKLREKDPEFEHWGGLPAVVQMFRPTPWLRFLRETILEEGIAILKEVPWLAHLAGAVKIPAVLPPYPETVSIPEWAERYPEPLHAELGFLAALSPEAQRTAKRILAKDFPPSEGLLEEVEVLKALVKAHPERRMLARRLENLQVRLQQEQRAVSPARLEHLRSKLRRAIRREVFRQVQENLRASIGETLKRLLDVPELPDWIWQPKHRDVLIGIWHCKKDIGWAYQLGIQLLRRRCGPPPWRPWEAKPNQEFLAQLRQEGIDPEPWVHPTGPVEAVGDNGRRVWLALEQDPLEIFQMGAYFNTCLSPWEENFFAAIVNAADANKQVLYARDQQGHVVGRCLLAISNDFTLLTYHPYCHDPDLNFPKLVQQFVKQLSEQMNIYLASQGKVRCLISKGWYSDNPIKVTDTASLWAKDSLLRKQLLTRPLGELRVLLKDLLEGVPLGEEDISQFLRLPELETRPELVLLILPYLRRPPYLSTSTYEHLFHRLEKMAVPVPSPFHEEIRRFVREICLPLMVKFHRDGPRDLTYGVARQLVRIDPWSVLRFIRATRPHGVRRDRDERNSDRRSLLAQAFAASGREDLARHFQNE